VVKLKRIILVTGPSGIGKTSVMRRVVKDLVDRKYNVGGVVCHEVREGGLRVGFEIMDLATETRGWLAHVKQPTGPVIGKYRVNLIDLEVVGAGSILDALQYSDILAIDEIGPMELLSPVFQNALLKAVESSKPMLGTLHYRISNPLVERIKQREDVEIIRITREIRGTLHSVIVNKLIECLI
jgi:nucleoside-triphosphatase